MWWRPSSFMVWSPSWWGGWGEGFVAPATIAAYHCGRKQFGALGFGPQDRSSLAVRRAGRDRHDHDHEGRRMTNRSMSIAAAAAAALAVAIAVAAPVAQAGPVSR